MSRVKVLYILIFFFVLFLLKIVFLASTAMPHRSPTDTHNYSLNLPYPYKCINIPVLTLPTYYINAELSSASILPILFTINLLQTINRTICLADRESNLSSHIELRIPLPIKPSHRIAYLISCCYMPSFPTYT